MTRSTGSSFSRGALLLLLSGLAQSDGLRAELTERTLHEDWQFKHHETGEWLAAEVPGCIHTDLLRHALIEDPYYRTNSTEMEWIDRRDWEYRTTFEVARELLEREHLELVFEGVDTYANIYLNDALILQTDNYFLEWSVSVKSLLQKGENTLRVHFYPAMERGLEKLQATDHPMNKIPLNSNIMGGLSEKKNAFFTRKPGYQFGWDWTHKFVSVGLRSPVRIRAWDAARIEQVQVIQHELSDDQAQLTGICSVLASEAGMATVQLVNPVDETPYATARVELQPGENQIRLPFVIEQPRRWWTNGLGEAHLYPLSFRLNWKGHEVARQEERIGLRTVRLVREPDMLGQTFYFELNGVPVFMKGANYIPQDNFLNRVTEADYEALIRSVVDANMNMIRVWGGGIYEQDRFYELCDEAGILVWQDFMFGGGVMYPATDDYLDNVSREVEQQIKRLRNHPSIALWCGNNEVYEALKNWGWARHFTEAEWDRIWSDYYRLFNEVIPELVGTFDPRRDYWPSSPLSDWDEVAMWDGFAGDIHYWDIWFFNAPFEKTNTRHGRFNSEYGFQSFPEMATIRKFSRAEDWDIDSEVMRHRQKSYVGNQQIRNYMEMYYQVPDEFAHFVYLSQVLQAYGVERSIENHRKHMPVCMGSLYWQLNDCWPAISWASLDYYQRWKALHYRVREAFKPVITVPERQDGLVNVYVVSDRLSPAEVTLEMSLMDFSGNRFWDERVDTTLLPNNSRSYFTIAQDELLGGHDPATVMLVIEVKQGDELLDQGILYFERPKNLHLPTAEIDIEVREDEAGTFLRLRADQLAKDVHLSMAAGEAFFGDNYFDLLPGATYDVRIEVDGDPAITPAMIQYITLKEGME